MKYYRHLAETGQDEKAGEVRCCYFQIVSRHSVWLFQLKEKEGDHMAAIDLYLKANLPSRAAKVVTSNEVRRYLIP